MLKSHVPLLVTAKLSYYCHKYDLFLKVCQAPGSHSPLKVQTQLGIYKEKEKRKKKVIQIHLDIKQDSVPDNKISFFNTF
jgi:hypothetical protein